MADSFWISERYNLLSMNLSLLDSLSVIRSQSQKQTIQRIINLDVFHFHFGVELSNYMTDFLRKVHKLPHDDHINLIEIISEIHNAEIIVKIDIFDCP